MVMKGDLTVVGGHRMQYTDHVSQKCILETYIILLNNVTPINLIIKKGNNRKKGNICQILDCKKSEGMNLYLYNILIECQVHCKNLVSILILLSLNNLQIPQNQTPSLTKSFIFPCPIFLTYVEHITYTQIIVELGRAKRIGTGK